MNEILKIYDMPLVNGDLQKYLDTCTSSTAVGSGTLCSTGLKESKLSFSPQTNVDLKRVPRLPHTQQSSQTTSQVQQILKNNRSDPNLTKNLDSRVVLDQAGSPIEYLKRFKIAKKEDQQQLQDSLMQESGGDLGDTFR